MGWKSRLIELKSEGATYSDIADTLNVEYPQETFTGSRVRGWWRRNGEKRTERTEKYSNGVYQITDNVNIPDNATPETILKAYGLKLGRWEVLSYQRNTWQAQGKDGDIVDLYQSTVSVKAVGGVDYTDIDKYFQDKKFTHDKPNIKPLQYDPTGEVLEICLPDLHSGLLAWRMETGADYDLDIVRECFYQCALDIANRCKHRTFKKIVLVTLGDMLHIDNEEQKTTRGTFQQADGRLSKIFTITLDMLIDFIDTLVEIAPTEVVYVPGNHDRVAGLMLLKAVEKAYRKQQGITFDTTPNPHKHRLFGVCLVGWTHGDLAKTNMPHWLQHHARKEYGISRFSEIHAGHFHSTKTIESKLSFTQEEEVGGILIRYLPTLCNASYWEHQQGYISASKTMMCFIWNESTGLRDTWHSNIV